MENRFFCAGDFFNLEYHPNPRLMNSFKSLLLSALVLILITACDTKGNFEDYQTKPDSTFTTPLGKVYPLPTPSEKLLAQFEEAKAA